MTLDRFLYLTDQAILVGQKVAVIITAFLICAVIYFSVGVLLARA